METDKLFKIITTTSVHVSGMYGCHGEKTLLSKKSRNRRIFWRLIATEVLRQQPMRGYQKQVIIREMSGKCEPGGLEFQFQRFQVFFN